MAFTTKTKSEDKTTGLESKPKSGGQKDAQALAKALKLTSLDDKQTAALAQADRLLKGGTVVAVAALLLGRNDACYEKPKS